MGTMVKGKKNKTFEVKHLEDGRSMLNLACGGKMHPEWNNIDFSTLSLLTKNMGLTEILRKANILSEKRFQRLLKTDPDIIRWDLRKGIPFEDNTFDVTYHSHFLEHLDKKNSAWIFKRMLTCNEAIRHYPSRCTRSRDTMSQLPKYTSSNISEG